MRTLIVVAELAIEVTENAETAGAVGQVEKNKVTRKMWHKCMTFAS